LGRPKTVTLCPPIFRRLSKIQISGASWSVGAALLGPALTWTQVKRETAAVALSKRHKGIRRRFPSSSLLTRSNSVSPQNKSKHTTSRSAQS
jgi:hypothetical protein